MQSVKRIIVVGGGFAGLNFIKRLAKSSDYEIVLLDRNNFHFFTPLLYQVAMGFIEPSHICYPFRKLFQAMPNVRFHMGRFEQVNTQSQIVITDTGNLSYDYLVLCIGTKPNYFGMENVKRNALPLKSIHDATRLRNQLLLNFEKATQTDDEEEKRKLLNVVVSGGGPTGVEVAGMLAEMIQTIGMRDYPEVKRGGFNIYLLEALPVLLGPMSEKAQREALRVLEGLGVKVMLNTAVKDFVDGKVVLSTGEEIATCGFLWTSGVTGSQVTGLPKQSVAKGGRLEVDQFNKVKLTDNIFALGDIAINTSDSRYPKGHPQLAPVAIQQGKQLAANFKRWAKGREAQPFVYRDQGSMAIISKYKAVVDLPGVFFKGFAAWLVWLFVHLLPIAGFRNKVNLVLSWAWAFVTDDPTLRLIIRPERPNGAINNPQPNRNADNVKQDNVVASSEAR